MLGHPPQLTHRASDLFTQLFRPVTRRLEARRRLNLTKAKSDPAQRLRDLVMQIARDPQPFLLLRRNSASVTRCLLEAPTASHVPDHGDDQQPVLGWTGLRLISTGNSFPSLRRPDRSKPMPMGRLLGPACTGVCFRRGSA